MAPEYFLRKMSAAEATDYLRGLQRRKRSGWEQARLLANVITQVLCGKETGITFPWEEEEDSRTPEEKAADEAAEARRVNAIRAWATEFNEKRGNENGITGR